MKKQRGVSLIEALFVLGIMAIIIGMVMVLYSQSNDRFKATALKEEIMDLKHIVDTLLADQPQSPGTSDGTGYYGLGPDVIIKSGMLPQKYINGNVIVTPYGGKFDFHVDNNGVWLFWIYGLSREACWTIATGDWGDIHNMNINGAGDWGGTWPPGAATQYCNQQPDGQAYIGMSFTKD